MDGIFIGGVGGAIAGVAVWSINLLREIRIRKRDEKEIYKWLLEVTEQEYVAD